MTNYKIKVVSLVIENGDVEIEVSGTTVRFEDAEELHKKLVGIDEYINNLVVLNWNDDVLKLVVDSTVIYSDSETAKNICETITDTIGKLYERATKEES